MRGIPSSFLLVFFALIFLIESISYFGLRKLINHLAKRYKTILCSFYLIISAGIYAWTCYFFSHPEISTQSQDYSLFLITTTLTVLNLIPKFFFSLMTLFSWILKKFTSTHLQMIILSGASIISLGIFCTILSGTIWGKSDINIDKEELYLNDLPLQLDGIKIVQLSDIHLGSCNKNPQLLIRTQNLIDKILPDFLMFTGDLVNNFGKEILEFEPYLKALSAKYGKYAIVGNHDYGDYSNWHDSISKLKNRVLIQTKLTKSGFNILLNKWTKVSIKDTSIYIIGVENWGHPPFPQYARLDLATDSLPKNSFKILLSHDPAYWESKVVTETDIPLTLSGHTHGGQFGIKIAGIEFSPLYLYQKKWGGLYKYENQYLYVNRGLGSIGFWGRIDMRPEITVLTLHRTKSH